MKLINRKILTTILFLSITPLAYGESHHIGLGLGLMPDQGSLGQTIAVDGMKSNFAGDPSMKGAVAGKGCSEATPADGCDTEQPWDRQTIIYPENELISMQKLSGGLFQTKTSGAMTGGVLSLFYEYTMDTTFLRTGVTYTKKVMGGNTESTLAGVKWYDISWDYHALYVPLYAGIKTNMSESSRVYGALGVTYFDGGFEVGGTNYGEFPTTLLGEYVGGIGATTVKDATTGNDKGGPILFGKATFQSSGVGFSALMGVEAEIPGSSDLWFVEIPHVFNGGYSTANTEGGIISHMSSAPTYPVVLTGTHMSLGYKVAL